MSNYVDTKYLNLLSVHLAQFKRKADNLYNFRCPYCGDSQKSTTKARGYVFLHTGDYFYKCHNCSYGTSLKKLIQDVDGELYKQYLMERFSIKERKSITKTGVTIRKPPKYVKNEFKNLDKISQLKHDHFAKVYVNNRRIPTNLHYKLFFAPKFYEWVNSIIPNKFEIQYDEPRLVLPFLDENKTLIGFQGRALNKSKTKYITIMIDESKPKVFGLDEVNKNKKIYVVEGPIDSLFLDNSIAMAGADLSLLQLPKPVIVYDNEPRNREIIHRMEKVIHKDLELVIWPDYIEDKDINDMIISGYDTHDIMSILKDHTYSGLSASAKLSEWRKVT